LEIVFKADTEPSKDKEDTILPAVAKGQTVKADLSADKKLTKAPVPFTEGTLITAMKTAGKTLDDEEAQAILKDTEGIGTEATRANILDGLKKRGYLVTQKIKSMSANRG
jgi:Topoisomerase IA